MGVDLIPAMVSINIPPSPPTHPGTARYILQDKRDYIVIIW